MRWLVAAALLLPSLQAHAAAPFLVAPRALSCTEISYRCDSNADCCSGFCSYQTCMDGPSGGGSECRSGGDACSLDSDCCSSYCASYGACG